MSIWKFALSTADDAPPTAPILLTGSVPENLEKASTLGYDAIEVHTREDISLDCTAIRRAEESTGVKVCAIVTGRLNTEGQCSLMDDRPYVTRAAMEGMERYIRTAAELQADLIIGWVRGQVPPHRGSRPYFDRLAENLRVLGEKAGERGVRLNLEVINRYEINTFNTAEETMGFLDRYELPNCFVHLDTFHMMIDECDPAAAVRRCAGKLGYVHLADNSRRYPGSGQIDFSKILAALQEIGYNGYLSVECFPYPSSQKAAGAALRYLKDLADAMS